MAVSRLLLIPGVPWEQDEALFGASAFDVNLPEHRPHPPGFPLWVGVARLSRVALGDPVAGLQLASALLSVLGVALLAVAWRPAAGGAAAVLGAALFAFLPGVWFHAVRAFTTTPALTFFLAAAVVLQRPGRAALAAGGALAGLGLAVRPILLPPAVVLVAAALWLRRERAAGWAVTASAALVAVAAPFGVLIAATGGPGVFLAACREHLGGHAGALHLASWAPAGLGIVRAAGGLAPFAILAVLAGVGVVRCLEGWRARAAWLAVTASTAAWLLLAHNRTYPRYTVPLFALLTVPAVGAVLRRLGRRAGSVAALLAAAGVAAAAWPAVRDQAAAPFPPLEALAAAAGRGPATAVVDAGVTPFGDLANLGRWGPTRTVLRDLVRSGAVPVSSLPSGVAAVWAAPAPRRWIAPPLAPAMEFRCASAAIARLAQGRYLEAWCGLGGGVLLEPADGVCSAEGTPFLRRMTVLVGAVSRRGRIGLVIDAAEAGAVTVRAAGRELGRWAVPKGVTRGTLRPFRRGGAGPHPWRLELVSEVPVRLGRVWIEEPSGGVGDLTVPPAALAGGLDGLVWGEGLYGVERFPGGKGRWTGARAVLELPLAEGEVRLRLLAPRPAPARVTLQVPPGPERTVTVGPSWEEIALPVTAGHLRVVRLAVANPFVPADEDPRSADRRELGVVVGTVRIVTSHRP